MPAPPPLRWSDLAGRVVGIWGWRVEGRVARARLEALGVEPVIVDDHVSQQGVLTLSGGGYEALARCQVVVKSPGVSRRRPEVAALEAGGVQVVGGLGLWMEGVDRGRVCCITGTKGKSTTVSVAGHLIAGLGHRGFIGGNLGVPPYAPESPAEVDWWVIETSSYQCTDLWSAPPVVAVTSLYPDHLDWHGSVDAYYNDKLSICRLPGASLTVANGADPELRRRRHQLGPEVEWVDDQRPPAWVRRLGLLGPHNVRNALMARACLVAMGVPGADEDERLEAAAGGFQGLPSRLYRVGTVDGVDFIDDSLSTNVGSTLAAVESFPGRRLALVVGGFDRGIDYGPLARALVERGEAMVLTVPDVGPRIGAAVRAASQGKTASIEVMDCADEAEAARTGFQWARPGGVVLLSPAAPSYGRYHDYRERSAAFAAAFAASSAGA
jgi:UDP-N-acetylmuramoylalanine--D-glutamate ligase